ncbi:MAG: citrate/2-methylcitrate synthase [Candidatus Dormibacteraceae bacterium]
MKNQLKTEEAAARLGVKPTTLYSYVSRGLLSRERGKDGRSRFLLEEVEQLRQHSRSTAIRPGHLPSSALTSVSTDGTALYFRGRNALDIAASQRFEAAAGWLWTGQVTSPDAPWQTEATALRTGQAVQRALLPATLPLDRLRATASAVAPCDVARYETDATSVQATGRRLISVLVDSLPLVGELPRESTISARLWSRLAKSPPQPAAEALLNEALVLLLDHELSLSTLSARLAASWLADPYSVVAAGLSTLGAPRQAGAMLAAENLLTEVTRPPRVEWTIEDRLRRGDRLPGFGHRLHRSGDPRAGFLLDRLNQLCARSAKWEMVQVILATTKARGIPPANVDFALGALIHCLGLERGASEAIFGLARATGWIAHALEIYGGELTAQPDISYLGRPTFSLPER